MALFANVPKEAPDPIQELNKRLAADTTRVKVDLGAGVYRNEDGEYHQLSVIRKAKEQLAASDPGHDYNPTIGISLFRQIAQSLVFGASHAVIQQERVATIQTVAGTGANRIGAAFLGRFLRRLDGQRPVAYVASPTWVNYQPLFENAGFQVRTYDHLLPGTRESNIAAARKTMLEAPPKSVFILQACCHNPTGIDFSLAEWKELATIMSERRHFAFFDAAYLGFSSAKGMVEADAQPIRYFAELDVDMLVCQSFSKNLGLYSERVGALHVLCATKAITENVLDQMRAQIRWEVSSSPAWGARLATIVMQDKQLSIEWVQELREAVLRMENNRRKLYHLLTQTLTTPGSWEHIINSKGLFVLLDLSSSQIEELIIKHHIYLPPNGRINVAGLSHSNIERTARALDAVVRSHE